MIKTIKKVGFAAAVVSAMAVSTQASAGDVKVSLSGVKNAKGVVRIFLYKNSSVFNNVQLDKAFKKIVVKAKAGAVSGAFKGIADGEYAVSVYHDANNNNNFDYQGMKLLEGYGYSNNVGKTDYATFSQAKFKLSGSKSLSIGMNY